MHVAHLWPARLYHIMPHYLMNSATFGNTLLKIKTCVLIFSTNLSRKCLILRRIKLHMIKMYIGIHVKYPLFFSDFNETWILSTYFRKLSKYKFSWKSVEGELSCFTRTDVRADRQTDRYDEVKSFSQFCEKRHNSFNTCHCHCVWFYYSKCFSPKFHILSHYTEFKIEHPFPKPNSLINNYTRKFCKLFVYLYVHCVILHYKT